MMFEAEADGLRELKQANAIRVPEILGCGIENGESFLELERFAFDRATAETERQLGERLAALHRYTTDRFGWFRDNTIGPTPQVNAWSDDWVSFFESSDSSFNSVLPWPMVTAQMSVSLVKNCQSSSQICLLAMSRMRHYFTAISGVAIGAA